VFEGARCYNTPRGTACFRLDAHMRRLYDSAKIYRMEPRHPYGELHAAVLDTIRANSFKACYIRPIVYRGYHTLGVNPFPCPVDTAIILWEWGAYLGQDALKNGVDVRVSSWSRSAPNTFPTLAKTSANYANSQLIKMEALEEGYSEGIALDTFGYLSEGSGQNLFVVRDNTLYTPPITASILPGITRNSVITLARDLGIKVREEMLPRELLYIADEAFFAGQDHDRERAPRPDHRSHPDRVLRPHQRQDAGSLRLAGIRVSGRAEAGRGSGGGGDRLTADHRGSPDHADHRGSSFEEL